MNYLDVIFCIPLAWGLYKGITKGLIIQLATFVALGLGIFGAIKFTGIVASFAKKTLGWESTYLPLISFTVIFLCIIVLVFLLAKLLEKFVKIAMLGWLNRLAGALFGVLKYALLLSVVIFIIETAETKVQLIPAEKKQSSMLYRPLKSILEYIPGITTHLPFSYPSSAARSLPKEADTAN